MTETSPTRNGARARLLEFTGMLRTRDQQCKTSESEADNVVVIPKR
jgi:hypothetical protein